MALPGYVHRLHEIFTGAGRELYAVGGCVRDALLGRPIHEYDLTTDAPPEEIKALARRAAPDSLYTLGEKFGTIGLVFEGTHVEITTYRGEWYEPDSRKPRVEWGSSLEEDLRRRDFTVNAVAREIATGGIIDPFGGRADLERRLVRAVGVPEERFRDDPLRLLRAVRFASTLGFALDWATEEAIRGCAGRLASISRERIRDELSRMLLGPAPDEAVRLLADLGLLQYIAPELLELRADRTGDRRHKDIFAHTLKVLAGVPPDLVTRWAALLHDVGKPRTVGTTPGGELHFNNHEKVGQAIARKVLTSLKYDRPTIEAVGRVVGMHTHANGYDSGWTDGAVRRLVREAGDALPALLALSRADVTSAHASRVRAVAERVDELEERIQRLEEEASIAALRPPLDGNDLMRLFDRGPGPWLKPILERLLDLVIDGELAPDDRERAEEIARRLVAEREGGAA